MVLGRAARVEESWTDAGNLFRRPLYAPRAAEDDRSYPAEEDAQHCRDIGKHGAGLIRNGMRSTPITERLEQLGATIYPRHAAANVVGAHVVEIGGVAAEIPNAPITEIISEAQSSDDLAAEVMKSGQARVLDASRTDPGGEGEDGRRDLRARCR